MLQVTAVASSDYGGGAHQGDAEHTVQGSWAFPQGQDKAQTVGGLEDMAKAIDRSRPGLRWDGSVVVGKGQGF
jgi:hypothetical protein